MMKKQKWKSAEHKRQHEELQKSWEQIQGKYKPKAIVRGAAGSTANSPYRIPPGRSGTSHIPSLADSGGVGARKETPVYSGDSMLGVSTLHKSNAVPVFSTDDLRSHATMRR